MCVNVWDETETCAFIIGVLIPIPCYKRLRLLDNLTNYLRKESLVRMSHPNQISYRLEFRRPIKNQHFSCRSTSPDDLRYILYSLFDLFHTLKH
jgi:hypothetical protein